MKEIPSAPEQLVLYGDFFNFAPEELYDYWVTPSLVTQWWPSVAETDPHEGGSYRFSWPEQNWILYGSYLACDRGKKLEFTWTWNHSLPGYPPLIVSLYFMPIDGGTRMSIFHSRFEEEDHEARGGILEGWIHFGMRLAGLRPGDDV